MRGCALPTAASPISPPAASSPERMRKIRVFSGPTNPCYISLDYRAQEGFIYRIAREGEEESSMLKKVLAGKLGIGKDSDHRQRICRQTHRPRAGADCQRRTAQAGAASISSTASASTTRPWSAANPPSARWTWPLKSPGRRSRANDAKNLHAHRRRGQRGFHVGDEVTNL